MTQHQEQLIKYVMANSDKTRLQAIAYCEANLIRWAEL